MFNANIAQYIGGRHNQMKDSAHGAEKIIFITVKTKETNPVRRHENKSQTNSKRMQCCQNQRIYENWTAVVTEEFLYTAHLLKSEITICQKICKRSDVISK